MQKMTQAVTPGAVGSALDSTHYISIQALDKRHGTKKLKTEEFLNKHVYEQRVRVTAETLLGEANHRAKLAGKKAYVHVVGLGLGVWKLINAQEKWYVDVFGKVLQEYKFQHVSDVDFSWIPVQSCCGTKDGETFPNTDIKVRV